MSQQGRIKSPKQLRMRPSQNQQGGFANRQQAGQQQQNMGAHSGTTQPIATHPGHAAKGKPPQR